MTDRLLQTLNNWQRKLEQRAIIARVNNAERHLHAALFEMNAIESKVHNLSRIQVCQSIRGSLANLVRYKYARGMVPQDKVTEHLRAAVRGGV